MSEPDLDEFRRIYESHVEHVRVGDMKAAMAEMVRENLPAVFEGIDVPRSAVEHAEIVAVRADGDQWIGDCIYRVAGRSIGLRSIWERHDDHWLAARLENFNVPEAVPNRYPWGPAADGLDQPYWDGLKVGELRLQRCADCHTWIWGPQWICGKCHTMHPVWEAVEPTGTVYTWSRSHHPFLQEYADRTPYVTVLVELPQAGGRRVLGLMPSADGDIRIGDRVRGRFELDEGAVWPLLRWYPSTDRK